MKNIIILVVVISVLIASAFSTTSVSTVSAKVATPMPVGTPEKPLTEDELAGLLDELKGGLTDLVGDEEKVTAITDRWDAREDLAGKTRKQVLGLLFADLRAVVTDKKLRTAFGRRGTKPLSKNRNLLQPIHRCRNQNRLQTQRSNHTSAA